MKDVRAGTGSGSSMATPGHHAETHEHGDRLADGLEREKEQPSDKPELRTDQAFRHDQPDQAGKPGFREGRHDARHQYRAHGEAEPDHHEESHLHRNPGGGEARHDHQASPHAAEDHEGCEDHVSGDQGHEIAPSVSISTPRGISTCESTGSVAKRRSITMRT